MIQSPEVGDLKLDRILISKAAKLKLNKSAYKSILSIPSAHQSNGEYKKISLIKNIGKVKNSDSLTPGNEIIDSQANTNSYTNSVKCRCQSASLLNSPLKTQIIFPKEKLIVTRSISQGIRTKNSFVRKHIKLKEQLKHDPDNVNSVTHTNNSDNSNVVMKFVENENAETIKNTICIDSQSPTPFKVSSKANGKVLHNSINKSKNDARKTNISKYTETDDMPLLQIVPLSLQRLKHVQNFHESIHVNHNADKLSNSSIAEKEILSNSDSVFEIKHFKKEPMMCLPKSMRKNKIQAPASKAYSFDDTIVSEEQTNEASIKCSWLGCKHHYRCKDKLTKHVKREHLEPASKNDVFVCLWKDCKFYEQPSCSYRWLSRHVLNHCDEKPFKCVIQGCDLSFRSQEGLAKHVPTHFNERQVRRTCVMTSRNLNSTPPLVKHFIPKVSHSPRLLDSSSASTSSSQCESEEAIDEIFKLTNNEENYMYPTRYPRNTFKNIHSKLLSTSSTPEKFHGYSGSSLNVSHVISGKRTSGRSGKTQFYVTSSLGRKYSRASFWASDASVRKRKNLHVSLPFNRFSLELQSFLYERDHVSSKRRKKQRK